MNGSQRRQVRSPRFRQGLILQLFALVILPLTLLLLIVTFWSYGVHERDMRRLVGERDARSVRAATTSIDEHLQRRLAAAQALSRRLAANPEGQSAEAFESSDYLLADFDAGAGLLSSQGDLLVYRGDPEGQAFILEQTQTLLSLERPTILTGSTGSGLLLAGATAPGGVLTAVGVFSAESLVTHSLAGAFGEEHQTGVLLLDEGGNVLYAHGLPGGTADIQDQPGVSQALAGESGTQYYDASGSEHVAAYAPVSTFGWALVVAEPWEEMANPSLSASQMTPLVLAPVLVLTVVALWFAVRQVVEPLRKLEARAEALAWGDHSLLETPVGGIQEIRALQAQLVDMSRKVQAAQQSLHGYIGEITAAQEDERRRLARDLHDDTIQSLIALKQRVQLVKLVGNGSGGELLQELEQMTEQTIDNLRRVTRALRPIYLEDLGLVTALEMLVRESERGGLALEFQRTGEERRLPALVELSLYRIAQEALSNVSRHAQATHAKIGIHFTPENVTLEVVDDGNGFEVPTTPSGFTPQGHFGLLGLYERADLIGATLEIRSKPGEGTRLVVELTE